MKRRNVPRVRKRGKAKWAGCLRAIWRLGRDRPEPGGTKGRGGDVEAPPEGEREEREEG